MSDRPLVRLTEVLTEFKIKPKPKRQFTDILEYILRYELAIILDEAKARMAYFVVGDFYLQNEDYICDEVARRLAVDHALYVERHQIKDYLKSISAAIEGMLESGIEFSALSYTSKSYQHRAKALAEAKEAVIMKRPAKMGRPRKNPPKREHKRRYVHPSGKIYESIAEAARQTNENYNALRAKALYDMKKNLNRL